MDKLTVTALEATLRLYLDEKKALPEIPVLRMLTMLVRFCSVGPKRWPQNSEKLVEWEIDILHEKSRVGQFAALGFTSSNQISLG